MQEAARYLLVRGVPGHLVANPHVPPETRRFLGKMPHGPSWKGAEPVEEVVKDEPAIRKAIARKGLELVREAVAPSIDAARAALAGSPAEVK